MSSPSRFLSSATLFLTLSWLAPAAAVAASDASSGSEAALPSARMIYVDPELAPRASVGAAKYARRGRAAAAAANPIAAELEAGLSDYRWRWSSLPQLEVGGGPVLRLGSSGPRVAALRERLGLFPDGGFDAELEEAVRAFQRAHGLEDDGIAGAGTIAALDRGARYYERIIETNIARARALPANMGERYIVVDTAAARLTMYEDGRPVDSMRVIVGRPASQTPMLAAYVRYAVLNPYWNVPPDLVRERIAPNVINLGEAYLRERGYELLSGYEANARLLDPAEVDWSAVAAGREDVRVRQRPGSGNMMGDVKFMLSDELGIYLHDTPDRHLFAGADRRQSSGCIRLEDPTRLGRWLFGRPLVARSEAPEVRVDLPAPVPVYVTYLTAAPTEEGIVFRDDAYGLDRQQLAALGAN